jgi:hypothetical protein
MIFSPQFLEAVNGVLLIIFLGILICFLRYIIEGFRELGMKLGYRQRRGAIGFAVLVLGDTLIRGSVWFWRHLENHQMPIAHHKELLTATTAAGLLVAVWGGICILRHFAPDWMGAWPWIVTLSVAMAFGFGLAL